jgi:hypothetical protein
MSARFPDLSPTNLLDMQALADSIHALPSADLVRLLASVAHEMHDRFPQMTTVEVLHELVRAVEEVHDVGLA